VSPKFTGLKFEDVIVTDVDVRKALDRIPHEEMVERFVTQLLVWTVCSHDCSQTKKSQARN
jgi:hypothetical protein